MTTETLIDYERFTKLAEVALEKALAEVATNVDAGEAISLAQAANDVLLGIVSPDELAEYHVTEDGHDYEHVPPEDDCICPPHLLARGGFKGGCPVHA